MKEGQKYNCFYPNGTFADWGFLQKTIDGKAYLWRGDVSEFDWPLHLIEKQIAIADDSIQPRRASDTEYIPNRAFLS